MDRRTDNVHLTAWARPRKNFKGEKMNPTYRPPALNEITGVTTPKESPNPSVGNFINDLAQREEAKGKMQTLAGPSYTGGYNTKVAPSASTYAADDQEIVARIKHTMRKGEHLMQWYARTGCGRA